MHQKNTVFTQIDNTTQYRLSSNHGSTLTPYPNHNRVTIDKIIMEANLPHLYPLTLFPTP